MKLTEKTQKVYDFIKENGGSVTTEAIRVGLGLEKINAVTGCINALVRHEFVEREDGGKTEDGHKITIVNLTEAGKNYVPSDDEE
jgi:SOS-response transcriptional repressor LexA